MKKLISLLMIAAMILSLAACSGGTEASDSSTSSGTESTASGAESEASEEDPILTGEKPELKVLSMYQAYNYEEQPAWKIDEEITGYKTKWYALPADNADQKLLLEISSGADYDVLLRISPNQYAQLSKQNALIDLRGFSTSTARTSRTRSAILHGNLLQMMKAWSTACRTRIWSHRLKARTVC